MIDYLNSLLGMEIPAWVFAALPLAIIILAIAVYWFVRTRIFKARLRRIITAQDAQQAEDALKKFSRHYPPERLVRYSRRMERYSRQMGPRVVRETGLADKWVEKLSHPLIRAVDLRRVLLYCPSSALFKAFLAAEQHPRLRRVFSAWMNSEGEEKVIRLLAESCRGEAFDPVFGRTFLENNAAVLRELTGEAEWYARYFAYRILLLDNEALNERTLDDGLVDPHPLTRKILTEKFADDDDKKWAVLWDKLVHDPVYEVREAARKRIAKEFPDRYNLQDANFGAVESARVLELLDPDCQEDRSFAMTALESPDRELRYPAAVFLEKCGVLASLLGKNTLDDPSNIENSVRLLRNALEVNVSGFLRDYPSGDGGPLLAAARLLSDVAHNATAGSEASTGSPASAKSTASAGSPASSTFGVTQEIICGLEERVFAFFSGRKPIPSDREIYEKTLDAAAADGNARPLELFAEELSRRENDPAFLELLLPRIPNKAPSHFIPVLFRFLENTAFPAREELERVLGNYSPDIILPGVLRILNENRAEYPHPVRISALRILGRLRLPFCLQRILESLPTLKPEETEEFAGLIASYPKDLFEEKAAALLALPDARIRASIISILPATKNQKFLKEVRSSLKDFDPDVRVAAIKALLGFGEIKFLNQETSMLRDPVERVRVATAEVIARHGNAAAIEILRTILKDPNETDVVKISVIAGLGYSTSAEGIQILVNILDSADTSVSADASASADAKASVDAAAAPDTSADTKASVNAAASVDTAAAGEFRKHAEKALAMRTAKRDITRLIEIFKDAEPQLREKLIPVFRAQGKEAEPSILEILKDDIASLKPYLVQILEETGYVDEAKRRLSHRNAEVRREAAMMLSLLDTLPAFRGLVLAAKDPDQEVRVCVVKALEKLNSSQSRDILDKLKSDPDNRVRKYTHWALERLDSLGME